MHNKFETYRLFWNSKNRPDGIDEVEEFETREEMAAAVAQSMFELSTVRGFSNIKFITHCGLNEQGKPFTALVNLSDFESEVGSVLPAFEEECPQAEYSRIADAEAREYRNEMRVGA